MTSRFRILALLLAILGGAGCGGGGAADPPHASVPSPVAADTVRGRTLGSGQATMERSLAAGRWLVFHTTQALVPGDTNGTYDVYLEDLDSGLHTRISHGNRASFYASLSADGNRVVYASDATDLVPGDTNGRRDVFLHDRAAGTTTRVSLTNAGAQSTGTSAFPAISSDGNLVVFLCDAKLVPEKTTTALDVFARDVAAGTTTLLSRGVAGTGGNGASSTPAASGDGRYVAFVSAATNLVPGDTNGAADVFLHDRQTSTTERVSVGPGGVQANGACSQPSLSDDGRFVAWDSVAANLVPGDTNFRRDVFVRDRTAAAPTCPTLGGNGDSSQPTLNRDGTLLAFASAASNLVVSDANGAVDVFWLPLGGPLHRAAAGDQPVWDSTTGSLAFRSGGTASVVRLVPDAPANVDGQPGDGSATLTWDAAPGADSYEVWQDGALATATTLTQATIGGLGNGQSYSFTVLARNAAGLSAPSAPAVVALPTVPDAPTGVSAVAGDGQVSLTWSAAAGADTYEIHVDGGLAATTASTSATVTGLTNGQSYTFVVYARNEVGLSAPSQGAAATPVSPTPDAPTGLAANAGDGLVALSWNAVPGATSYDVHFLGDPTKINTTVHSNYTVTGLANGQTYVFVVYARNAAGASGASAPASATLNLAGAPVWAKRAGSTSDDDATAVVYEPNFERVFVTGNFQGSVTFGSTTLTSAGSRDIFVACLNPATGATEWAVRTGSGGEDSAKAIGATNSGVFVAGSYGGTPTGFGAGLGASAGGADAFVVKLNGYDGTPIFARRGGSTGSDSAQALAVAGSDVLVIGNYTGTPTGFNSGAGASAGSDDVFVTRMNVVTGSTNWTVRGGASNLDRGWGVAGNGFGVYVTGEYRGTPTGILAGCGASQSTQGNAFAVGLNPSNGAVLWAKRSGSTSPTEGWAIACDSSSRVFVAGRYQGTMTGFAAAAGASAGGEDLFVAALDRSTGNTQWAVRTGGTGNAELLTSLAATDATVYVGGYFSGGATGFLSGAGSSLNIDGVVAALDASTGAALWAKRSGGGLMDSVQGLHATSSAVYAAGYYQSTPSGFAAAAGASAGGMDAFVTRLNP